MSRASASGFSADRLQRIDRFLHDRYIAPGHLPCAQISISRRGEVVHEASLGWRDVERKAPCEPDTVFRIYSMTKPITSVAIMSLVEEGALALDDPVARYIPSWAKLGVFKGGEAGAFSTTPPARPMQIVDLLRHTAGLTYGHQRRSNVDAAYRVLNFERRYDGFDLAEFVEVLAGLPLEYSPGEAWTYSVATDVLGHIVEVITGRRLDEVLQERVFSPLGMTDTGFQVRPDQSGRLAACYAATAQGGLKLIDDPERSPYLKAPRFLSGGGGLVSTTADYRRFLDMLLAGGEGPDGARILAPRTIRQMRTNHLPGGADLTQLGRSLFSESTNAGVGFGLGFAVAFDPARSLVASSVGESHWGGGASTAFWIDPVEEVHVILMTQVFPSHAYPIRRELRSMVYAALTEPNA